MLLNAHAGAKYGIPFPVFIRAPFGVVGANIQAILRAVVACGFTSGRHPCRSKACSSAISMRSCQPFRKASPRHWDLLRFYWGLRKLSASDRQWYHDKIGLFKQLRRTTAISESFFPLGSWLQTSSDKWDGFARLARSGDGIMALFRNKSAAASATIQLPLIPPGKYRVHSIFTGKILGVFSKADWSRGFD